MGNHVRCTGQDYLYTEQQRSNKQEGELNRFRDTREHGREGCREQKTASHLFLFGTSATVHSQSRTGQTENHEDKFTGEIPGCVSTEMCHIRRSQLSKEDVLTALYELAINHHAAAHARLPERQIEYMVQTKRNQRTLNDTENQRTDIARARDHITETKDDILGNRPDKGHGNTHEQEYHRRYDGDKAGAAKEGQRIGKNNLIIAIVQHGYTDTNDNTAKYAHLQGHDAAARSNRTFEHARCDGTIGQDFARQLQHSVTGNMHDEEGNHGCQCCYFLLGLSHTNGYAHGKDNRQVAKNRTASRTHNGKQGVQHRAITKDGFQTIGLDCRGVGKRCTKAQQKTCNRQYRNRQHETAADTLQYAKNLVFH